MKRTKIVPKVIAFDADDTLWVNEPFFQEKEKEFCRLLSQYESEINISKELFKYEMQNLAIYGYGAKGFMLSMIETAISISKGKVNAHCINSIIDLGKQLLTMPIVLLDGVEDTLKQLAKEYKLVVATKGDLLDQENKLEKSGLASFFDHIEVMSDKTPKEYLKLIHHLGIKNNEFLMVGNSVKSDILPVLAIEGNAIHVPYHTTWQHEVVSEVNNNQFVSIESISRLKEILK